MLSNFDNFLLFCPLVEKRRQMQSMHSRKSQSDFPRLCTASFGRKKISFQMSLINIAKNPKAFSS